MKKTGVIVAVDPATDRFMIEKMVSMLTNTYPGVRFCVLARGRDSVVFEYEEPE